MQENTEKLLSPLKYYENELKEQFRATVVRRFSELTKQSGVDLDRNRELAAEYKRVEKSRMWPKLKIKCLTWVKRAVILAEVLWGFCYAFLLFIFFFGNLTFSSLIEPTLITLALLILHFRIIKWLINKWQGDISAIGVRMNEIRRQADESLLPLKKLLHSEITHEIIRQVLPLVKLDDYFDIRRFEQLVRGYSLRERMSDHATTLSLISGDIVGNPFVFVREWDEQMEPYTYTGSILVSVNKYYTDSDGNRRSKTVAETVSARIQRPGPVYHHRVFVYYGNEAAPNLSFSRQPTVEAEKPLFPLKKSAVQKNIKRFRKKTKEGTGFQIMANEEFDGSFNAEDRNHEQEFRLLFTPLAQENFMYLFAHSPHHDNFYFWKRGKLNEVRTINSMDWRMNTSLKTYYHVFYDQLKANFINFNCQYFDQLFFMMLPILSIPLYQQHMAEDYIYGDTFDYRYNSYLTEMIVNQLNSDLFRPNNAAVRNNVGVLVKTYPYQKGENSEIIRVRAYSFRVEPRVTHVLSGASDGSAHSVPVHWEEYIRVYQDRYVEVMRVDTDHAEDIRRLEQYARSAKNSNGAFAYRDCVVAKLYDENQPIKELVDQIIHG